MVGLREVETAHHADGRAGDVLAVATIGSLRLAPGRAGRLVPPGALGAGAGVFLRRFRQQADMLAGLIMIGMAATLLVKALEMT